MPVSPQPLAAFMKRNLIVLGITFAASLLGVFVPWAAAPFAWVPTVSMLVQLLFCFLSTTEPSTPLPRAALRDLPRFLAFKMLVVPLVCWAAVRVCYPEYALGALLVSGASIGVMAPFFAFLCGAEPFFVVGGVIASSLVLPVTIPLLAALVLALDGQSVSGLVEVCLGSAVFLGCCMLLPFAGAKLLWAKWPGAAVGLLARRFGITLVWVAAGNGIIFSRYSAPLREHPASMGSAALAGVLTACIMLGIGIWMSRGLPVSRALGRIIGVSCVNCGLMVIVGAEFFSLPEVLVCALYTLILMSMGVPYEGCRRWLSRRAARQA